MSDYLGNLVARTLSSTVGVRPQLLSVFEPPPANSDFKVPLGFDPHSATESSPVAPADSQPVTPSRMLPHVHREPAHEPLLREPRASSLNEISPTGDEPDTLEPLGIAPQFGPRTRLADEALQPREDWGVGSVQPRPPRPAPGVGTTEREVEDRTGPPPPSMALRYQPTARVADKPSAPREDWEVEFVQPRSPRRANDIGTTEPAGEERISSLPVRPSISLEPTTEVAPLRLPTSTERAALRPSVKAAAESDPPQPGSVRSPALRPLTPAARIFPPHVPPAAAVVPPPTIQVTIGRVEVRATPPPAARQRPRAAAPMLTLEDYLRRRASGGPR